MTATKRRGTGRRAVTAVLSILGLCLTAGLAFLWYIGWFGGAVMADFPASADVPRPSAAVYLSGDVGPQVGLGGGIIDTLRARGAAVVSVNSAAYFNQPRSPDEVERLVGEAVERAATLAGTSRVMVVGHSFGADMLQVALARMKPQQRARIAAIIYIAPSRTVEFQVSPLEMLGLTNPRQDAATTARLVAFAPQSCIYGEADANSLCPVLPVEGALRIAMPGGHNLKFDSAALHRAVMQAIDFSLTQSSSSEQHQAGKNVPM
ncbi:MAG: type IV secretion system protein VirJ [Proteobacteria bacterium]|nr:type IV secretion system protein VirJ [Pseudomonadota bacterium]